MPKDMDVLPLFERSEITFPPIPRFLYDGNLGAELASGRLSKDDAANMLDCMLAIRYFEETVAKMKNGRYKPVPGFRFIGATHLSIGQEATAVGAVSAIGPDDYITSTHRGHGHSIAKGFYWLLGHQSEDELSAFVEGYADPADYDSLAECALQVHLNRTMAELMGKEEGYCHGRGGGMHIADFHAGHLGANAIVGGSYAIAAGAAMGADMLDLGRVVLCFVGDGATNNGIAHEAYNWACQDQFEDGIPVIFMVENNQYGMTGQQVGEVTGIDDLAQRGAGYNDVNMHAEVLNGMDACAVRDAVARATEMCRGGEGPVLLESKTYRYMGHSLSDDCTAYRSETEEQAWEAIDPIDHIKRALVEYGVLSDDEVVEHCRRMSERIETASVWAVDATDPKPSEIYRGLFTDSTSDDIGDEWATPEEDLLAEPGYTRRDRQGRILYRHAVAEALMEEMLRDRRVILYGEDLADYGGAFGATRGLMEVFGRRRVFNAPISEAAIVGTAAGASMVGMRPVAEIMYIDFILMTMDQTGNQLAKNRYMFGGKATLPAVIRTTVGGGKGYAGQHSQSLEAIVTQIPGLKVVAPSTPYDCKGLLKAAIRDDNPVIFIEHQHCYTDKGEVPEGDYTVPLGEATVAREGSDVTVIAYSYMMLRALEAAEALAEEGISVEVVDPRTLIPLDEETIAASVNKTGRALVVQQAPYTGCFGEHIAHRIMERCWDALQAPVRIVASYDVPPPMAAPLEEENIPSVEKIADRIRELVKG
ncbi:MAG: alpha-ketoacid dehydrogenase subunit alpha/beta [Armatimonadota bacterium]|jgi:2-oxoisovalerate dehydrogenase E1 component